MALLTNQVALITGASRGIGEAIALKLASEGAHIAFTYVSERSAEKAQQLVQQIQQMGVQAKAWQSNAADYTQAEQLVNEVLQHFGRIDICVNNAGISKDNLLLRLTPEQWDEVLNTNLKSVYNITRQVIKPMMKARSGSIINMSSIVGIKGNAGQSSYAASKAGIIGFTKSIAQELGSRQIRCNAVAPGFIETDMTAYLHEGGQGENYLKNIPLGRFGKAEDVANVVLFLASPLSSYVTGQVISVCGGLLM
ncbi:3-oxoacyl-[acyl-carrier-protein] reductase [Thermoflavifilum thermophilum]|uniref:3-oxoacyl-[acyl-carrier-protein] reductase n=1 Tax=Thermoflavifilum thermophilum TaxID=1393122 RepID=A0A1I7N7L0_9BACT|nr:3-oxoacyl-[acyl-carrier-protein] reductase [Thermoflavifilum thermophilum]SFV30637.1 3-oxoacyl-[acyl-carrier-protein] reductase [Thermoflavifilum thermophilum]